MAEPHVLTGSIAKRAEIAARSNTPKTSSASSLINLDHIDAAIHIFDPGD
jgi:hypothetical protein